MGHRPRKSESLVGTLGPWSEKLPYDDRDMFEVVSSYIHLVKTALTSRELRTLRRSGPNSFRVKEERVGNQKSVLDGRWYSSS